MSIFTSLDINFSLQKIEHFSNNVFKNGELLLDVKHLSMTSLQNITFNLFVFYIFKQID